MRRDLIAIIHVDVVSIGCHRMTFAVCDISRTCTGVYEAGLGYGDAVQHTADGSVEYVIVECSTASRAEGIREGLGDRCEHCTLCQLLMTCM